MKTAVRVNRYKKSATTANRDALSRGEKAALAVVGSVCAILMSIWLLHLLGQAIDREEAFREARMRPYIEQMEREKAEDARNILNQGR